MTFPLTRCYKATVTDAINRYAVRRETYIGAKNEAAATRKLRREGYVVHSIKPVLLNHLGGEVPA